MDALAKLKPEPPVPTVMGAIVADEPVGTVQMAVEPAGPPPGPAEPVEPAPQVSGWGVYCHDFLLLPVASCCF